MVKISFVVSENCIQIINAEHTPKAFDISPNTRWIYI